MAGRRSTESSSCFSKSTSQQDVQIIIRGVPVTVDRELLAAKSARLAVLLRENSDEVLSNFLRDIEAGLETFELVARFCQGYDVNISAENVIPLCCLCYHLEMTENYSNHNLLPKALAFLKQKVLPSWNESIKAIRSTEYILRQAVKFGLVDACLESIVSMVKANPCLLGEPMKNSENEDEGDENEDEYKPNPRRKLFDLSDKSEDLTSFSLDLYEPIIVVMIKQGVSPEYIAASVCQYAKKWISSGEDISTQKRNNSREVIEAVQRLLPDVKGLLPSTVLFQMLRVAIVVEASSVCKAGFEYRIGKQLDQAQAKDLLIPSLGYAKEVQYDIECVRRILKNFYGNYEGSEASGLSKVAEMVEEFMAEISSDIDLKKETFISLLEISIAASSGIQRTSDGIYKAIDIYLSKHKYLTESEKEEVCKMLDCNKLSHYACEHAAQNGNLPLRLVVQVLFVSQLHLRGSFTRELQVCDNRLREMNEEEEEEREEEGREEEEEETKRLIVREEMEKMESKVMQLERECSIMRREIESGCCRKDKAEKFNIWREVKRKLGCMSSMHDCHCQVKKKKVHPR